MLWPFEIWSRIAGTPSFVAGILTITFGRRHRSRRSSAHLMFWRVLLSTVDETSMLTNPSLPFVLLYTGLSVSAPVWTSLTISPYSIQPLLLLDRPGSSLASSFFGE